jgi:uncharacterized membrane protein
MKKSLEWLLAEKGLVIYWLFSVAAYSALSLFRHWHFESSAFDLGIFDQGIWHYSLFEKPACTINQFPNLLGDHFDPTLALLAPLYWICPHVEAILVAQAILLTLPVFPVFLFTQKRLGRLPAFCFAISYAMLWELQAEAQFDFHELTLAVPAAAFAIYFADEEKWGPFFASVLFMVLCKEDLCLVAIFMGLILVLTGKRVQGMVLAVAALALFLFEIKVLMPYLGGRPYDHWRYSQLGADPVRALGTCLAHPLKVLAILFSNWTKTTTVACLFLPFFFGAFFSPWGFLAIPLICERMLSDDPDFWVMLYQYNVMAAPILCLASADGFYRLFRRVKEPLLREKMKRNLSILILVFNVIAFQLPHQPLGHLIRHPFWRFSSTEKNSNQALALVPADASVLAQSCLVPHLSHRQIIVQMDEQSFGSPPMEDYVVACLGKDSWPLAPQEVVKLIHRKESQGYQVLFHQTDWVVLKKMEKVSDHAD